MYPQVVVPVAPSTTTEQPAGRRTRRRIVFRINGEIREIDELQQALEVLKSVKKDVPELALQVAETLVKTGQRIGDAKRAQQNAIAVVDAPYSIKDMIQTRLNEIERLLWRKVAAYMKVIEDDDEDVLLL